MHVLLLLAFFYTCLKDFLVVSINKVALIGKCSNMHCLRVAGHSLFHNELFRFLTCSLHS